MQVLLHQRDAQDVAVLKDGKLVERFGVTECNGQELAVRYQAKLLQIADYVKGRRDGWGTCTGPGHDGQSSAPAREAGITWAAYFTSCCCRERQAAKLASMTEKGTPDWRAARGARRVTAYRLLLCETEGRTKGRRRRRTAVSWGLRRPRSRARLPRLRKELRGYAVRDSESDVSAMWEPTVAGSVRLCLVGELASFAGQHRPSVRACGHRIRRPCDIWAEDEPLRNHSVRQVQTRLSPRAILWPPKPNCPYCCKSWAESISTMQWLRLAARANRLAT